MLETQNLGSQAGPSAKRETDSSRTLVERAVWESIVEMPYNQIVSSDNWYQLTTPGKKAPNFNGVYRCEKPELTEAETRRLVREVIEHYRSRGMNFRWKTTSSTRPQFLAKILRESGMILKDLLYGYVVTPNEMGPAQSRAGIEVHPLSLERLEDWLEVQARGWGVPSEGIEFLRGRKTETLSKGEYKGDVISYWHGKPAGAAGFIELDGYAFMLGGAVIPEFRGKGLYRALIDARFDQLRRLGLSAVFHCVSTTSAPVLDRMGFERVGEVESHELPA